MMAASVHIIGGGQQQQSQEPRWMNSPNGYTQMDNSVQQHLFRTDLNGTQHAIIHAVIQLTWRFRRVSDRISAGRLAGLMGRDRKVVQRALKGLLDQRILVDMAGELAVNPCVEEWQYGEKQQAASEQGRIVAERVKRKCGDQTVPKVGTKQSRHTNTDGDQTAPEVGTKQSHEWGPDNPQSGDQTVPLNNKRIYEEDIPEKESSGTRSETKGSDRKKLTALDRVQGRHPDAVIARKVGSAFEWGREDDLALAIKIHGAVAIVTMDDKPPSDKTLASWSDTIRLMIEQDRRTHSMIWRLFAWSATDDFWRTNILSPSSLRKNWGRLAAKYNLSRKAPAVCAETGHRPPANVQKTSDMTLDQILDNDW
jgi:phage replication O-like protein O